MSLVCLTNLIQNPSFENTGWPTSSGKYVFDTTYKHSGSYSYKMTGTTSTPEVMAACSNNVWINKGHIYYNRIYEYHTDSALNNVDYQLYVPIEEPSLGYAKFGPANQWNMLSLYGSRDNWNSASQACRIDFNNVYIAGSVWYDDIMLIDLTADFGPGKEPDKEWCDTYIPYFDTTYTISTNLRPGDIAEVGYSHSSAAIKLPYGIYRFEAWGAGDNINSAYGGYSVGDFVVNTDNPIYVCCGGKSTSTAGGYNGGGTAYGSGFGGSGATHIGFKSGLLTEFSGDYSTQLLMVAGAGGGRESAGNNVSGLGGGASGADGTSVNGGSATAGGGTQTAGGKKGEGSRYDGSAGSFGKGGSAYSNSSSVSGAGGSGFYGGGGGGYATSSGYASSGGGGSGYVNTSLLTNASTVQQSTTTNPDPDLNGHVRITAMSIFDGNYTKQNGNWCPVIGTYIKANGQWKYLDRVYNRVNGQWLPKIFDTVKVLDALESTGEQYVDIGYIPKNNAGYKLRFISNETATDSLYFGQKSANERSQWSGNANNGVYASYKSYIPQIMYIARGMENTLEMNYKGSGNLTLNNLLVTSLGDTLPNASYPVYVFCGNNLGTAAYFSKIVFYELEITEGTTVVAKYIPARNEADGAYGLYDTIGQRFYRNLGNKALKIPSSRASSYTELPWIKLDGSAWIDTELPSSSRLSYEVKFASESTSSAFSALGSIGANVNTERVMIQQRANETAPGNFAYAYGNTGYVNSSIPRICRTWYVGKLSNGRYELTHDGITNYETFTPRDYIASNSNFVVLGRYDRGTASNAPGMLAYCKIWDGDRLVRNLVAARRSDGVYGMADKLTDIFYPCQGGSASPNYSISDFTAENQIISLGKQWIDTGVPGNLSGLKIDCEFAYKNFIAYGAPFGNYDSEDSNVTRIILHGSDDNGAYVYHDNKAANGVGINDIVTKNDYHKCIIENKNVTIDGTTITTSSEQGTANSSTIALFGSKTGSPIDLGTRFKYFKVYQNGTLIKDLWPMRRNSNGELGMYDKVNNIFHNNLGTSSFIAEDPVLIPIGGRIFYIHNDNGAEYMFFDSNKNIISDISVSGLTNAYYYAIISGTPSADKFYVYDNSGTSPVASLVWATATGSTGLTAAGIGAGKTNTATAMTIGATQGETTIFYWATHLNVGGYTDWYIGSESEIEQMRLSGLESTWFSRGSESILGLWSSTEGNASYAREWFSESSANHWVTPSNSKYNKTKANSTVKAFAIRSF